MGRAHVAIEAVAEAVARWNGPGDLAVAGPAIYRALARQRGLPEETIAARLASSPGHPSAFERYDLPGISHYWRRRPDAR